MSATEYIVINIKSSATLLFVQLTDEDTDDSLQNIVDFVVRGLTDNEDRKIYKCKIAGNSKIKKASLDLYDPNIYVMPSKCKYDYIVINADPDNYDESELSKLYFEKDTSKFVKDYLNEMIHAITKGFVNFAKDN